jgi:F420-dependent oxidoreductase-like protein
MRLGLQVPDFTWPGSPKSLGPTFARIARTAEASGLASLWVMDHFFQIQMVGPPEHEMLEGYTTLAFAAAVTERVQLGTMVTGVTYRHPGILGKTVTTLDVLSGGRAYLGIGAAWNEQEHRGLGVPFPPLAERFERLEETLRISRQMFSGGGGAFEGEHYRLEEPMNNPPPVSSPRPPIMVGGMGEQKTLRLVARHADACNLFTYGGTDLIRHKLDVLRRHCEEAGRDYEEIERTSLGTVHLAPGEMGVEDVISTCRELSSAGIEHAIFNMPNVHDIEPLETFGREIIPAVADL